MDVLEVLRKIKSDINKKITPSNVLDFTVMVRQGLKDEDIFKPVLTQGKWLSDKLDKFIPTVKDLDKMKEFYSLHEQLYLVLAPFDFDAYCMYIEWDRKPKSKFYAPRRKQLRPLAEAMQELYYGDLELLCISMPPGTGKSALALFFLSWWGSRKPDRGILTISHNFVFVKSAYEEIKKIIGKDSEYRYHEVFPEVSIKSTDAQGLSIALDRSARFATFQFGSLGSGLAGRVRAESLLFCDDLIPNIEVALSEEQLQKAWTAYTSDLLQRKVSTARELHIATRWSVRDILGRLELKYESEPWAKFIKVPALDAQGRSKFDYPFHLGYSSEQLWRLRDDMDEATFNALYQQEPIEREGQLYADEELQKFFTLPDRDPDAILAVCDTKDRGEDYFVLPIAYQYGNQFYIQDVICNDGKPEIVEEMIADALIKNKVQVARFESNSAGGRVAENVQKLVNQKGGFTKITTKYTTANKETKIIVNSAYVKEHFLFKDNSVITKDREYKRMMQFLKSYTLKGKNKHDDVPDAMAMLALFVQDFTFKAIEVFTRPF